MAHPFHLALHGVDIPLTDGRVLFHDIHETLGDELVALIGAVLREPTPRLLLLDEPTNHLDLQGVEALEAMLESWPGALVVVSYDEHFPGRLMLTHQLRRSPDGWV
jgi:ATPase subunit of ABC transporter with duplicated ATPase domains